MPKAFNLADQMLSEELKFISSRGFRNGYLWEVKKIRSPFEVCPKCATASTVLAGKAYCLVREAPLREKPLWLRIQKHRYYCKTCRKPFTEPIKGIWPRRRSTTHFRKAVAKDCENYVNLNLVRKHHSCSSGFIYKVHYETLEIKLRDREGMKWPEILGIDEHFFTRRNGYAEFVTVFCDLRKRRLFEMCKGKDTKSILEAVAHYPGRENVKVVVIDLSNGYLSIVRKLFPNAKIVADKFHALRLLNPAMMKLRKQINGNKLELKQRRLLLRNREDLTYTEKKDLDKFLHKHPLLEELYWYKERLRMFYNCRNRRQGIRNLECFIQDLRSSILEAAQILARTLERWKVPLANYFEKRWTNGFTEATNGNAKALQKRARGFKNFVNYRLKTLNACFY
ncbi:MAG: ISL3 family transposase [Bdellovibrio sp.]